MAIVRNIMHGGNGGGSNIIVVANYSALPNPTTVSGQFYWCSASQGTSWLPGSLGGTYYNSGMYYSNGTTWEFINVPYQATLAEVNTGTNTDKFVTPETLKNQNYLATKTQLDALNPLLKRFYFDDFLNLGDNGLGILTVTGGTLQTEGGLSNIIKIGAGTKFTKMPSELNRDGILRAQVGNINGNIRIRHSNLWIKSTDSVVFASNFRIQTLSTATERYILDFRFFINNNNFITCRYSDNVNSGNFQFITSASSVKTTVNTSINVAINTWYELEIRIINGTATLFINGVEQLPISTNILLNASYDCQWFLVKTASQANAPRTVDFDYLLFKDL